MIIHTFADKCNSIIRGSYLNTGLNPVGELTYGSTNTRLLVHFPIDNLVKSLEGKLTPDINKMRHILHMTNTSGVDLMDLHCKKISSSSNGNKQRATSFYLIFFLIPKDWDAGKGFHFTEKTYDFDTFRKSQINSERLASVDGCNWFQRKNGMMWDEGGIFSTETLDEEYTKYSQGEESVIIARQKFDVGYEDISVDITETVNKFLVGELENHGIGIAFTPWLEESGLDKCDRFMLGDFCKWVNKHKDAEDLKTDTLQATLTEAKMPSPYENENLIREYKSKVLGYDENFVGFFTNKTNTFFEPYLETVYDDCIADDRSNFCLDKNNRLYFYASVNGNPINLDHMPTCSVINDNEESMGQFEVKQTTTGAYYIDIFVPSSYNEENHMYHDVWSNIYYNEIHYPDVELDFTLTGSTSWISLGSSFTEIDSVSPTLSGILESERIRRGDIRKLKIDARIKYNTKKSKLVDDVEVRLYILDGTREIDVFPFHKVNKTADELYTIIDTNMLIPYKYHVDVKCKYNMQEIVHHDSLSFWIADSLDNRFN